FMLCQNCKTETEEGKFCANCGVELIVDDSAATVESANHSVVEPGSPEPTTPIQSEQTQNETNEYAVKLKGISSDFGQFFMTLVKKPSEAKNVDQKVLTSSIIVMLLFSILVALNDYISISNYSDLYGSASFAD